MPISLNTWLIHLMVLSSPGNCYMIYSTSANVPFMKIFIHILEILTNVYVNFQSIWCSGCWINLISILECTNYMLQNWQNFCPVAVLASERLRGRRRVRGGSEGISHAQISQTKHEHDKKGKKFPYFRDI